MTRYVHVTRTIVTHYRVPADEHYYPDMDENQIRAFEMSIDPAEDTEAYMNPEIVSSVGAHVWFSDEDDDD